MTYTPEQLAATRHIAIIFLLIFIWVELMSLSNRAKQIIMYLAQLVSRDK